MRIQPSATLVCVTLFGLVSQSQAIEPTLKIEQTEYKISSQDWPWWRGPNADGVAPAGQTPPLAWSESKNIVWKSPVVGRGHGSPIVVGDSVYLATADESKQSQHVICFDRKTGTTRWITKVASDGFPKKMNKKASMASSTLACDGERLYANFLSGGRVTTSALNLKGEVVWSTPITDYVIHQGYGSSPSLYGELVIVSADNKGGGAVAALDRKSGDIVWRIDRPKTPNYSSPIILHVAGKDQVILTGCDLVTSLNPRDGSKLWEIEGATTECVTSTLTDGTHIYTSGGYPTNHMAAVVADGSGTIAWKNKVRVYVPSMLIKDQYLYAIADAGIAYCFKAATGEEVWKERIGGTFSASPILVGDRIYVVNEDGEATIFRASPDGYHELGKNKLGDEVYATPIICGNHIYLRVAHFEADQRREVLYCIGTE